MALIDVKKIAQHSSNINALQPGVARVEEGTSMDTATIVPEAEDASPHGGTMEVIPNREAESLALSVELVEDDETFLRMGPMWNRLVDEAHIDHPFLRHEWVRTWWECFKPSGRLYILIVKEGVSPIAIAPLMFDDGRMYGYRVRRLRGIANVYTERFDLILTRRAKEACRAIWKFLAAKSASWDMLELRQIPEGASAAEYLRFWAFEDKFLLGQWHSSDGPYIPINKPWDSYVKTLSKKHLSNMRGRAKGLHRIGEVRHEIVTGGERLNSTLNEAFLLEAAAWKGKAGTAIINQPDRLAFYRTLLTRAAEQGWLQLHFLTIEGKRIAVQMALLVHNKLYILKSGYDPHYAPFAPSLVLCDLMLKDAWKRQMVEVDFLGDAERWKLEWASHTRAHCWLFMFPNRPMNRLLHRFKFQLLPRLHEHRLYRIVKFAGRFIGLHLHD
jgi:CelD/BcsL family acetyltransferase involved in cellulose biosynthesis